MSFKSVVFVIALWMNAQVSFGQEIEPRAYSNAPIGLNFISAGIGQAKSAQYTLTSEVLSYAHIFDVGGQSAKLGIVLPYAELSGAVKMGGQSINASSEGLSDPLIRASVNLYGAPALSSEEFKSYKQDLIIGASLAASIPWGKYDSKQLLNVGANRWFIQPGFGGSKAIGSWRLELAGAATIFTDNNNFVGGNALSQAPIYSAESHVIYYLPSTAWLSVDASYFTGGQSSINGIPSGGSQENWRFGGTFSTPIDKQNAIKFYASTGVYSRTSNNYDLFGVAWQYRWGPGL
jgi:hypothetical protein